MLNGARDCVSGWLTQRPVRPGLADALTKNLRNVSKTPGRPLAVPNSDSHGGGLGVRP